jgi:hypothetical protein
VEAGEGKGWIMKIEKQLIVLVSEPRLPFDHLVLRCGEEVMLTKVVKCAFA